MSLVRLLTAGKSFVGLKESGNRYRVTGQRLLPKFESNKNPFKTGAKAETGEVLEKPAPLEPEPVIQSAAPISASPSAPSQTAEVKGKSQLARWTQFWKGCFSSFKPQWPTRPRTTTKPGILRPTKTMVQVELSLEKVRVVRNDLSDSDVEIVTAKVAQPAKTLQAENSETTAAAGLIPTERPLEAPRRSGVAGRLFAGKR
jgi:hypothetical protein